MKNIFLYGPPASGKSTLGKLLARALKAKFIDLDAAIEAKLGYSIAECFRREGETGFRQHESETLREVMVQPQVVIIALGGGTLLDAANRELCEREGAVLCLEAPSEAELTRRIAAAGDSRPLGNRAAERAVHYAAFPHRIQTFFDLGNSLVLVGSNIARDFLKGENIVVDSTVERLYLSNVSAASSPAIPVPTAVIPSGEKNKTPSTVMNLWSAFARSGLSRAARVAALGGGVTGDLAGFAAATWMRGIDWLNFPTTLLSMVDASVGGKTGCDLPEGKNLAGAFHSPQLVVIDVDFLKTLPPALLADGRAEMIKHEIISGGIISRLSSSLPTAAEIAGNLAVKVEIVRQDPEERTGRRLLLNCGHTVGHAVEKASGYRLSHGQSVAIGCVAEARLAVKLGLAAAEWPDELAARFRAFGLPTELPAGMTFDNLKPLMAGDKKKLGDGTVAFALPCGWGDVRPYACALNP